MTKYYKISAIILRIFALFIILNSILYLGYYLLDYYGSDPSLEAPYDSLVSIVLGIALYYASQPISKKITKDLEE